ncbi:suppressor of fused domain protein [Flavobacterium sp. CBA20B-1]|uniref:suppressor of fused domain protein n=1 Tax=unclassified Flavobacterium TaxID=196869 RepID=UPI0022249B4F|nr:MULTISPECIES: suppressor of fused domain protein [unclassified Flavobacterium]WCM41845.1 suppressor of fused domain protein [Flavobacterium sp. CBA20B-1]
MIKEEYQKKYTEEDAVGWLQIDEQLEKLYPQQEPKHYGPLCGIHFMVGGTDPIDGASIYNTNKQTPHKHLVSYGMSELYYNEEALNGEFSKWGFEFTFRLKPFEGDIDEPTWVIGLMNNLARYVFQSGNWFEENQYIPTNGPIRANTETEIVGLVFTLDPELGKINTPHGEVSFLQIVGTTKKELEHLKAHSARSEVEKLINKLKEDNPLLITDLNRK